MKRERSAKKNNFNHPQIKRKQANPDHHHFVNPKRSLTLFGTNDEYPLSKYQSGAKA
jgi:hypothetical protein